MPYFLVFFKCIQLIHQVYFLLFLFDLFIQLIRLCFLGVDFLFIYSTDSSCLFLVWVFWLIYLFN